MELARIEKNIGHVRFISIIAVIASGLGSLLLYVIGAVKVVRAYKTYFSQDLLDVSNPLPAADLSIAYLIQAIDAFLIALVLMVFGGGIYNVFVHTVSEDQPAARALMSIRSISELKSILAELVIFILMVKFLEVALKSLGGYQWEMLILPVGVLMLAVAVRVLRLKEYK